MACKEDTLDLNGRTYYVVQMPAIKAVKMHMKLVKLMGATLPRMVNIKNDWKNGDLSGLSDAIEALFEVTDEEELTKFMSEVVETAKIDGKPLKADLHFEDGHVFDIYRVFFWVLGVNFSSFFAESNLDGLLGKFKTSLEKELDKISGDSPATSAPTSTGTSGNQ